MAGGKRETAAAGEQDEQAQAGNRSAKCESVAVGTAHCHTRDAVASEKSQPRIQLPERVTAGRRLISGKPHSATTELDDGSGLTLRGSWTEACPMHDSSGLWPSDSKRETAAVGQAASGKPQPSADVAKRETASHVSTIGNHRDSHACEITDTPVSKRETAAPGSAVVGARETAAASTPEGGKRETAAAHTSLDDSARRHAELSSKGLGCARSAEAGRSREPSLMPMPTKPAAIALPCAPGPRALVGAAGRRLDVARAALKTPALARSLSGTVPGAPRAIDALGQPLPVP
ncbi:MAG: hypothetical protein CMH41_05540, partial [Micrococcales bacterium]|nr:hypothetical protein [Micrococcales bacterium]